MPTIRQLPPSLVNKIAAGEVIERPASVVKELLENSVDAGATSIEVLIEGGGTELIRISDNGCGISEEQIPLAVASHATSKLETADDLFDVHTLGFRGEALASIAEVSHVTLRTRTSESTAGCELEVRGGNASPIEPAGCPEGTTIEVRHLFFNTPVRKKFLRTAQTEAGHITEAFTRIALAFPEIQMRLHSGKRTIFDLQATDSWKERIRSFFGDEVADALIEVESMQDDARLAGYVADPSVSRSNNRMQYLFLNGRHIRDRSLQHALGEAYRGLLMVGRFPICFLRLDLPPAKVDVNVHPTKMEVRFQESGKLYSQMLRTLRHEFLTSDLTARARNVPGPLPKGLRGDDANDAANQNASTSMQPGAHQNESRWDRHAESLSAVAPQPGNPAADAMGKLPLSDNIPPFQPFPTNRALGDIVGGSAASHQDALPPGAATWQGGGQTNNAFDPAGPQTGEAQAEGAETDQSGQEGASAADGFSPGLGARQDGAHDQPAHSHLGFQVHNRYLVTQDETGMVVVDQHALHERILYEQLRAKADERKLESQRLLVPEPLDLSPAEVAAAIEFKDVLAQIGIEVEPFGGDTILMSSYPAILAKMRPAEVLRQVLEPLMAGGKEPSARDLTDELLHMIACKAAIKAGDRLASEEITSLLEQRDHYQNTHHCPHGRPTALFFSRDQLDKMFGRT